MTTYKLSYFNSKGRAEVARLLFAAANQKYEDERVEGDDWPKRKADMPQGSMPVLEQNGTDGKIVVCQSFSICRHLARQFNLYGKTNLEAGYIDMIMDTLTDLLDPYIKIMSGEKEGQDDRVAAYRKDEAPKRLGYLENLVKEAGTKGFAVGATLSVADLAMYTLLELTKCDEMLEGAFPLLAKNRSTVKTLPRIADWLNKRPQTQF